MKWGKKMVKNISSKNDPIRARYYENKRFFQWNSTADLIFKAEGPDCYLKTSEGPDFSWGIKIHKNNENQPQMRSLEKESRKQDLESVNRK